MILDHANLRHIGYIVIEVDGVGHILTKVIHLREFGLLQLLLNPPLSVQ